MKPGPLMDADDKPFGAPRPPFRVDHDGDIVDADGWLVVCPARDVWHDDRTHALNVCRALNEALR